MNKFNVYKIDNFLLAREWNEEGAIGRISYVVRGGDNEEEHKDHCQSVIKDLIDKNDEDYTSWVFTDHIYKDIGNIDPHVSTLHFRVRDSY